MNISIFTDLRFTSSSTPTGVGKHIEQMVFGLQAKSLGNTRVIAAKDQLDSKGQIPSTNRLSGFQASRLPLSWKMSDGLWTVAGGPAVDSCCKGSDWVYCPKNDYIPLRKTKLAVTIHGAHELDPAMSQPKDLRSRLNRLRRSTSYNRIVKRADLILTVSEFLKGQIIDWFGADEAKIEVVGNGVENVFFEIGACKADPGRIFSTQPYLLCVGGLNTIDGGNEIIATARLLNDVLPDMKILVAGWQHNPALLRQAEDLPNIKLLGYVDASKLAVLMSEALALLFLTRYETFGIAAAEAMASGTPVITAGGTAVPEIVGDAGLYVTTDPEDIVAHIERLLIDDKFRHSLISQGLERVQIYTWQACVDRLIGALECRS